MNMRSEKEMFDLILDYARKDDRIRVVAMNGSRANPNIQADKYQDFDIVYLVNKMDSFLSDDGWLEVFGKRVIMQKPDSMSQTPLKPGRSFAWLMLFEDGNRIDLTLLPLEQLETYLKQDSLLQILLDKDERVPALPPSTDADYWVRRPTPAMFENCCNEFWWLSTYVAKALARQQLPYANAHLNLMREELMRMLSWCFGFEKGFTFSIGKDYKYLQKYIAEEDWLQLLRTWRMDGFETTRASLNACLKLFRKSSQNVAQLSGYPYPDYDARVTAYLIQTFETEQTSGRTNEP